jgi:hypothetical protein
MLVLFLCVATSIPFAYWTISKSRLPSWMEGMWKWPLGNDLSPRVATLYGWANLFVGASSLALLVLVAALPASPNGYADQVRLMVGSALFLVIALLAVGVVLFVRSMRLSNREP